MCLEELVVIANYTRRRMEVRSFLQAYSMYDYPLPIDVSFPKSNSIKYPEIIWLSVPSIVILKEINAIVLQGFFVWMCVCVCCFTGQEKFKYPTSISKSWIRHSCKIPSVYKTNSSIYCSINSCQWYVNAERDSILRPPSVKKKIVYVWRYSVNVYNETYQSKFRCWAIVRYLFFWK